MTAASEVLAHLSFGGQINGRQVNRHIGPIISMNKSAIRLIGGGKIHDKLEAELNLGLERLLEKARAMGGNAVVNVQFREVGDFRSYMMCDPSGARCVNTALRSLHRAVFEIVAIVYRKAQLAVKADFL